MAEPNMHNPYEHDGIADSEFAIGRGAACGVIAAFVLILLLPPLYRNVYEATVGGADAWVPVVELFKRGEAGSTGSTGALPARGETIAEHLKAFEEELEDKAAFTGPPRQFVQGALAGSLREGNRKTYIGRDGWLYLKPALDALAGYGPLAPEPDSVAKDPNRKPWAAPLGAIKSFACQLDELGVQLVLVPIPVKPMIYPEHVTGTPSAGPLQHRDAAEFFRQIDALPNAQVIDLSSAFWAAKAAAPVFLKQDTHWTPSGMAVAVEHVAAAVAAMAGPPQGNPAALRATGMVTVENIGDLVEQLDLPGGGLQWFLRETATIEPVSGFVPDPTASITLLGDSFTNIYSQKSLNWGEGAGFAQHLALKLGQPLDVIATNGQASTGVRQEFARRGRDHIRKKKVVIWAIAARDLFLSETGARQSGIEWEDVAIPDVPDTAAKPSAAPADAIDLTATLISKSAIADPAKVTYKNALFVSEFKVGEVHAGSYAGETILIKEWAFRDKQLTPASAREPGERVRFRLIPFDRQSEVKGEQEFDGFDEDVEKMILPRYWPLPADSPDQAAADAAGAADAGAPRRASVIASLACALASVLVIGMALSLSRSGQR